MKTCAYCGKENEDGAVACAECGTSGFKVAAEPSSPPPLLSTYSNPAQAFSALIRGLLADPPLLFRALVILSTSTYVLWFLFLSVFSRAISPGVWDALAWDGYGALLPLPESVCWLFFLLNLAVAFGLWNFSKSARLTYVMLTIFDVVISPFGGVYVETAMGSFLAYVCNLAAGAILVMTYTPPLKEKFS